MKVTAILPDQLIASIKTYSKGQNLTECLVIAMKEWVMQKKLQELNQKLEINPLSFKRGFSATRSRSLARQS